MKFRGGEFSTGTMRNFQSELTHLQRGPVPTASVVARIGHPRGLISALLMRHLPARYKVTSRLPDEIMGGLSPLTDA